MLWTTRRTFPLTPLLYILIFLHACIRMLGGAYSYARVPLGFEVADEILGTQGDPWDTQPDMFTALLGALAALALFSRFQDRQIRRIGR